MNAASSTNHAEPSAAATPRQVAEPCIGGLVPFSSVDWPGRLAAVVFIAGCPWRCDYCHNPHLQPRTGMISWRDCLALLEKRRGLLDAVVFSGGEPLSEPALPQMIAAAKELGYQIGLHTGGAYVRQFQQCLPLLDWVGFDIKHTLTRYDALTHTIDSGTRARQALEALIASGVPFECRSTVHPLWHDEAELLEMAAELATLGVRDYALQCCRPMGDAERHIAYATPADFPSPATQALIASRFERFHCRT